MLIKLPPERLMLNDWPPPRNAWPLTMSLKDRGKLKMSKFFS